MNRRGFTLMEVVIALSITGLVATLAASAVHAGMDVRDRVQEHRATLDAESRAVEWIGQMLRHPAAASAADEALFSITRDNLGNATTTFLTQGVESPAGTGTIWRVTLDMRADGLHINTAPANGASARIPMETVLPHVKQLAVEALESSGTVAGTGSSSWRSDWPLLRSMPAAVRISIGNSSPVVFPVSPLMMVSR